MLPLHLSIDITYKKETLMSAVFLQHWSDLYQNSLHWLLLERQNYFLTNPLNVSARFVMKTS